MIEERRDPPRTRTPELHEVADGVFGYIQPDGTWWVNNTGFLVGEQGVVSIDACATERRTLAYRDRIASVTARPVRTVVNTHHHGDHTFGNYVFEGASIVAHENTRRGVLGWGLPWSAPIWTDVDWGDVRLEPPFVTFTESVALWSAEQRCEVRHVGTPAHTDNDSFVWLPERKVLFAGDLLFNGGTPFLLQGSIAGTIEVLEGVLPDLGAEVVVPGHGPLCGPELIGEVAGYARFVRDSAAAAHEAGLAPLAAARELDLGEYAEWGDPERIVGNLHRAYAEIEGSGRGAALDYAAILDEMVAFNGGPLVTWA